MYKAGDKFEVVGNRGPSDHVEIGSIVTLLNVLSDAGGMFSGDNGVEFCAGFDDRYEITRTVRPLRTEAEKRGAKFGVGGVVKETSPAKYAIGKKILFVGIAQTFIKEEVWNCIIEGETETTTFFPSNIRLDHEPEYKEIPFSEATHEQRMDAGNLIIDGGLGVSEIMKFDMAGYVYTLRGSTKIYTDTSLLTIRIPA